MPIKGSPTRKEMGTSTDIPMEVVNPGSEPISMPSNSPPAIHTNVSMRSAASRPASSVSNIRLSHPVGRHGPGTGC